MNFLWSKIFIRGSIHHQSSHVQGNNMYLNRFLPTPTFCHPHIFMSFRWQNASEITPLFHWFSNNNWKKNFLSNHLKNWMFTHSKENTDVYSLSICKFKVHLYSVLTFLRAFQVRWSYNVRNFACKIFKPNQNIRYSNYWYPTIDVGTKKQTQAHSGSQSSPPIHSQLPKRWRTTVSSESNSKEWWPVAQKPGCHHSSQL